MMALSKQQMMGAVGGGAFALCAGVLGWLLYAACSERSEAETTLEDETEIFRGYNREAVFPSREAIAAVTSNKAAYAQWYTNAVAFAARGDRAFAARNGSDFKDEMLRVVRRLQDLPGGAKGKIVLRESIEASFGFEEYLGDSGRIPNDEDVPRLAAQLDAIRSAVELFSTSGVMQVNAVRRVAPKPAEPEEARGKKPAKKGAAPKDADAEKRTCLEYVFEVTTRPAGFVAMLNGLTSCTRFCAVKDLSFRESADMILDRIAAAENAAAQRARPEASGRRGRRRGAALAEAAAEPQPQDRVVVDPELDAPLRVTFTLAVHDFGRAPAAAEAKAPEAAPAPAAASVTDTKKEGK